MNNILSIAIGGAAGALCRYFLAGAVNNLTGAVFPWGTMIINLSGSFVIGLLAEFTSILILPVFVRPLLMIGFLGAYTTFSTFSLETMRLLQDGEIKFAAMNMLVSNVAGILLTFAGVIVARLVLNIFR